MEPSISPEFPPADAKDWKMRGVQETFHGKDVFVTGGTGFMGKVLLEKMLRCCKGVGNVYVLLRPKKGKSIEQRMEAMLNVPLFEPLKKENPSALSKLHAVAGDCSELRLGLSAEDEAMLAERVSFVFHAAASVRFDDPLKQSLLLNTRGTREMVQLAKKMKRLEALQYVSTTYCFTNQTLVEERAYEAHLDWREVLHVAEHEDEHTLNAFTYKLLDFQPNTYTFSKALAENIINDARNEIRAVIFRPAVVISAVSDPLPGWIDNLNGPFGIWAGGMKGVLRYVYGEPDVALSFTPVDWAIRGMLLVSWAKANDSLASDQKSAVDVVNMEGSKYDTMSFRDQTNAMPFYLEYMSNPIRYPRFIITPNYIHFWLGTMISQVPFAMLLDIILRLAGQRPRLLGIYRKVFEANTALAYFTMNEFPITTRKIEELQRALPKKEILTFSTESRIIGYDRNTYTRDSISGLSKYLFKEEVNTEKTRKRLNILRIIEAIQYLIFAILFYYIFGKSLRQRVLTCVSI